MLTKPDWPLEIATWSPDGLLLALTTACGGSPIAWTSDASLMIATVWDGCSNLILDSRWRIRRHVELHPSADGSGTVIYSIDARTGAPTATGDYRQGRADGFTQIGTLQHGSGIIAFAGYSPYTLWLTPLDGSPPSTLTTLKAPKGMSLCGVAVAR